ncbi:uncharacterized protein [Henckelia pumila]|uniref:uncharacterized protein isoform X4 n=1 Tax=Henckelia pumila TaxID=405737 RepID=UPI003C6E9ACD
MDAGKSKVQRIPNSAVLRSVDADELSLLRLRCDVYMDPRKSLNKVTHFYVDGFSAVTDSAKAALNVYNEKERKNFIFLKVVKLNQVHMDAYLTFWAWIVESCELRLFRAVVKPLGGNNVLLCEIKDGDIMTIPDYHEECCPRISRRVEHHSPYKRGRALRRKRTCKSLRSSRIFPSQEGPIAEPANPKVEWDPSFGVLHSMDADKSKVQMDPNSAVLRSVDADELSLLRHRCDVYMDPRKSLCEVTCFYVDGFSAVSDSAKAALNVYNEKEQKNFTLLKVVKLNLVYMDAYLTFWAWIVESCEFRLFRAVVKPLGGNNVFLCETKDDEEMTIPDDHEEYSPCIIKREEDQPLYTGSSVGRGGEDLDSVGWDQNFTGYHSMDDYELSLLRHICDIYMDPRKSECGGGFTQFYVDGLSNVRDRAKTALNVYNAKEQKNFYLERVVKLNKFSRYYFLTFWARSDKSDERRLFRAVVDLLGPNKVLVCEIKDGEEMMVQLSMKNIVLVNLNVRKILFLAPLTHSSTYLNVFLFYSCRFFLVGKPYVLLITV